MAEYVLNKLNVANEEPVSYELGNGDLRIDFNACIGRHVEIIFKDKILCSWCGKATKRSFAQGYCYNCFVSCPETEGCILRPELCMVQWGEARDMEWAKERHLKPHCVYLAYTGNFKVGVTRKTQIPTRWIDQGAMAAVAVLEVPNRHIAGVVEDFMKQFFSDRTKWNEMLNAKHQDVDFSEQLNLFRNKLPEEFHQYLIKEPEIVSITYPLTEIPSGLKTVNLDKEKCLSGVLSGIKGQYLVFKDGKVINVRKHTGYVVNISLGN